MKKIDYTILLGCCLLSVLGNTWAGLEKSPFPNHSFTDNPGYSPQVEISEEEYMEQENAYFQKTHQIMHQIFREQLERGEIVYREQVRTLLEEILSKESEFTLILMGETSINYLKEQLTQQLTASLNEPLLQSMQQNCELEHYFSRLKIG